MQLLKPGQICDKKEYCAALVNAMHVPACRDAIPAGNCAKP